jgi:hypothetical protein
MEGSNLDTVSSKSKKKKKRKTKRTKGFYHMYHREEEEIVCKKKHSQILVLNKNSNI